MQETSEERLFADFKKIVADILPDDEITIKEIKFLAYSYIYFIRGKSRFRFVNLDKRPVRKVGGTTADDISSPDKIIT